MREAAADLTHSIVSRIVAAEWRDLPADVAGHALNTFVNFIGCAVGGSQHEAVGRAMHALCGPRLSSTPIVIGRAPRIPAPLSALLKCISASVYAFDDSHAEAVVHPGSVIGSALLGLSDAMPRPVSGSHLLLSFAWGVELICRLSKALSVRPAQADPGWSQSGVTGAIGAAASCGKLLGLNIPQMSSGIGIAACLSSGLRAAHGTMTMHLVPAQAASLGVQAALLAQSGFTGPEDILEGRHGYLSIFAIAPHTPSLSTGLGTRFELLANTFKAYPCGIVIHPVIDACLRLRSTDATIAERIEILELFISEATARLADRPNPRNEFEAQVSVQHWAAAALLQGTAEIAQGRQSVIDNVKVRDLRVRCRLTVVPEMAVDAAAVRLVLRDGGEIDCRTAHCKGSLANPLSGDALEEKFMNQSVPVLGVDAARTLLERCRSIPMIDDIGLVWSHL